ncbi:MIP family channel protein [Rutstroemia sp. NJR-2017a WRK4]|nr:MIP family channel protein [Rutstroemia sp. NJR-2017a BBW]PQE09564.1 MIP family channel protein [Rutstroemia sp. NJR-2017a WRK4]
MSGEGAAEQFYGGRPNDGELIKRPQSSQQQLVPTSPPKTHQRDILWSPGLSSHPTPVETQHPVFSNEDLTRPTTGLRRRPSHPPPRRYSGGDYDPKPSFSSDTRRPLRTRDELFYESDRSDMPSSSRLPRRDEYTTAPHPDAYERSRPPRTYRNVDGWERGPSSSTKTYFDESRSDFPKDRDLEKGPGPEWVSGERLHRRKSTDESIDGYNYEAHKSGGTKGTLDLNNLSPEERAMVMRLPWTHWMNSEFKNHFVATIGEFVGTTMFLFFAFAGTQVANIDSSTSNTTTGGATGFNVSVELYIAIIFGFSLMVNVWIFFRISGGLFNPAVTLGMVLVGALPIVRAICLFFAQIIGGITASAMVLGLFPTTFNVRTTLGPGTSTVRGVFIEAILTAELVFTIFMLAKEKHKATFIAPVGIGLALFIAEMVGVFYTGGSLNPARSFGPCVVSGDFDKEHWIYWIGPIVGTCIAVFFYKFIKMLEYEMANPGQDGDAKNDPTQNELKRQQILEERQKRYEKRHKAGEGSFSQGAGGSVMGRPGSRLS